MAEGVALDDESKKKLLRAIGDLQTASSELYECMTEIDRAIRELRALWKTEENQVE